MGGSLTGMAQEIDPVREYVTPTKKQLRARRNRSLAIGVALAVFVILVYFGSLVKIAPHLLHGGG